MTASPSFAATIINEDFQTDYGVFTPSGQVSLATGATYQPCCGTTGNTTNQFVAFGGGNEPSGTIMSATFNTLVGSTYTLMFDYGALGSGTEPLFIDINGAITEFDPVADNNLDTTFQTATLTFTGMGATTLSIFSGGVANVDAIFDNVSVVGAVPEPEVWALLLLGFAGIGLQMRRRRGALRAVTA